MFGKLFIGVMVTASVVVGLLLVVVIYLATYGPPTLVISAGVDRLVIDTTLLGEYHLGLNSASIRQSQSGARLYEGRATGIPPMTFDLAIGSNDSSLGLGGRWQSPFTPSGGSFVLAAETEYSLTCCGDNGSGRITCATTTIRMPAAQLSTPNTVRALMMRELPYLVEKVDCSGAHE